MSTYRDKALIQRSTIPIRHRGGALTADSRVLARVADAARSAALAPTADACVTSIGDSCERSRTI
jgi:hypothetical protein